MAPPILAPMIVLLLMSELEGTFADADVDDDDADADADDVLVEDGCVLADQ